MTRLGILTGATALLALGACTSVSTALPAQLTTQTAAQVDTLAKAEEAATIAFTVADAFVKSGASTSAQRATIQQLADAIGADVHALRADRDAGRPMVFDTINLAIARFNAFRAGNQGA